MARRRYNSHKHKRRSSGVKVFLIVLVVALLASAGAACANVVPFDNAKNFVIEKAKELTITKSYGDIQVTLISVVPSSIRARDLDERYLGTKDSDSRAILLSITLLDDGKGKTSRHSQLIIVGNDYERLYNAINSRKDDAAQKLDIVRGKFEEKDEELWYNALFKGEFPSYSEFKRLEKLGKEYRDLIIKLESELRGWNSLLTGDGTFSKLPDGSDLTTFVSRYVNINKLVKAQ